MQKDMANEKEGLKTLAYKTLFSILGGVVLLVGIIAGLFCNAEVTKKEHAILIAHSEIAQDWINARVEVIHSWQSKLLETIRFVSQAEMFRIFAKDFQSEPDSVHEEIDYLRPLLADTASRRGWENARLLDVKGKPIIAIKDDGPVTDDVEAIIRGAHAARSVGISAIYEEKGKYFLDILDPLYEVLGPSTPEIVGYLHVAIPMEKVLKDLLAEYKDYKPIILSAGPEKKMLVKHDGPSIVLHSVSEFPPSLNFSKRNSVDNPDKTVWSVGARIPSLSWIIGLEYPNELLDASFASVARTIYGLWGFGSLAVTLVITIIVGSWIVRHKAQEEHRCIGGLVHAIECALDGADEKLRYLQGRSEKVANLSLRLGDILNLSGRSLENIKLAARLSQVGKIFVPRDIMIKRGLLTDDERRQVQLAPYHAFNVLKGVLPGRVARIVYQMGGKVIDDPKTGANHELLLKDMLLEARVLLVANDFCAMVSQRGTRPPLPIGDARKKLEGRELYDKEVVAAINTLSDSEIREILEIPNPAE